MNKSEERSTPGWAGKASREPSSPNWQDFIPRPLWELGKVFFPVPRGRKGWNYPHHLDSYRYTADSEILNAYFDQGWGYGVACEGDLIVLDIDDRRYINEIIESLPDTVYQWTGSGDGVHIFYFCEGVTKRVTLKDITQECPDCGEDTVYEDGKDVCDECGWQREQPHIGELKADSNGYVVGPGSRHPSGNDYGPLHGERIERIDKSQIANAIIPYVNTEERRRDIDNRRRYGPDNYAEYGEQSKHEFYELTADDILPWLEKGKRMSHPIHGSDTGSNFMKNNDGETFVCWRCQVGSGDGCVINANHLLAMQEYPGTMGKYACEEIRRRWSQDPVLHYYSWKRAVKTGLIPLSDPPYTVIKGFLIKTEVIEENDPVPWRHQASEQLKYEMQAELRDDVLH